MGMPNAIAIVQNAIPREMIGAATGTMSSVRSLGGSLGVALSGCVMQTWLKLEGGTQVALQPGAQAISIAVASSFACGAIMMFAALLTCTRLPSARA